LNAVLVTVSLAGPCALAGAAAIAALAVHAANTVI
jgi:hypothetical protein